MHELTLGAAANARVLRSGITALWNMDVDAMTYFTVIFPAIEGNRFCLSIRMLLRRMPSSGM
jgi:hypothetical protein